MKTLLALVLVGLLSGCSAAGLVNKDLATTITLAEKYGKPEIAMCATFLKSMIEKDMALLNEDTNGLISLAMKYYLLGEADPQAEAQFKAQCGSVAAGLILQGRQAIRN